jgi:hypothetical protein
LPDDPLVTDLFAGSFGVRLQSKTTDLFGDDETTTSIQSLVKLIEETDNPKHLSASLHKLNILARSRFKHLLRVMVEAQVSLKAEWGSPSGKGHQTKASFLNITQSLQLLEAAEESTTRIVNRKGRLVGVDVQSDFFALVLEDGDQIKGKLAKDLLHMRFEVPSFITATVEETSIIDPLTDRERWSYRLVDMLGAIRS